MKAIQIRKVKEVLLTEIPAPKEQEGYSVIQVKAMGICGSDVHAYSGKSPNVVFPQIIGHETAGIVTKVGAGSNQRGIREGDRVVLNPYIYCGQCYPCSKGRTNCCTSLKCLGVQTAGSMSEQFAHPTDLLVKVPDKIDWETCALIEPAVIALHAIHSVDLQPGEHVAVVGAGCIGMLIGILAAAKGGIPIMVDVVDARLELAEKLGMRYTVNPGTQDAEKEISAVTKGRMAECVCEVSGSPAGIRSTLDYAAATGRIALTGWPNRDISLPTALITRKELQIRGSRTGVTAEFEEVIRMLEKDEIDIKGIISRVCTLDEIPEAVRSLDEHPEAYLKVIALN